MKPVLLLLPLVSAAPALHPRAPPNIPSAQSASVLLAALAVRTTDASGYSRDLFPHWITQSGTCKCASPPLPSPAVQTLTPRRSTREVVLERDGTNVVQSSSCAAVSGSWVSPYDGATWTDAADVVCPPPWCGAVWRAVVICSTDRISTIWSRCLTRGSPARGLGCAPYLLACLLWLYVLTHADDCQTPGLCERPREPATARCASLPD